MFLFTGEYLSNRSWQGLDQQLGETPVVKAVEGQFGIAAGYTENPANKDMKWTILFFVLFLFFIVML